MKSVCGASNRRVVTLTAIGLCFAVVTITPAAAPAAQVGTCETTGTKVKVSEIYHKTPSMAYVPVNETAISFTQRRPGCVIVSFSAVADVHPDDTMFVIATVDGFGCSPYDVPFLIGGNNLGNVRAMNFLCVNVQTGHHTAKIMFRSTVGERVAFEDRTTIVHYSK